MRLLVIGGSDAGISAGLRARELDPSVEVTLLVADRFPNFSICGLPYYLSGDVADWRDLAHRTTADLEAAGLQLLLEHAAQAIDPVAKRVAVTDPAGVDLQLDSDRLVVATGAVPVRPPIDGLDLGGVHLLHTMGDTFTLHHALTAGARSAVIVGGGYIGLEMAEAFSARGLAVTLVEQAPAVMPTVDVELGRLLGEELGRHRVQVVSDVTVKAIGRDRGRLVVAGEPDFTCAADLVLVVVGVRPDTDLAVAAGIETGMRGAIRVDRRMHTSLPRCWPPATVRRPTIGCWTGRPTCRLGPLPTSRAGWPGRPPSAGRPSSRARWAPKSSRSSTRLLPAPGSATRTRPALTR
jgi:NADPH-dependent 2,4-dienoyl-CoA reductase/sulfur reductase-like enzyme